MNEQEYQQILDHIDLKYEVGTDWTAGPGDPKFKGERHYPDKGYIVVYPNQMTIRKCDWCSEDTDDIRTYSRNVGSNMWKAKCHDKACKLKCTIEQKNLFNPLTILEKK